MRISGNLDQDGGNGDGEKWRDVRCVFKLGLIQDLPLDWMGEGKKLRMTCRCLVLVPGAGGPIS